MTRKDWMEGRAQRYTMQCGHVVYDVPPTFDDRMQFTGETVREFESGLCYRCWRRTQRQVSTTEVGNSEA